MGMYLFLFVAIQKMCSIVKVIYGLPLEFKTIESAISTLAVTYIGWILVVASVAIGILGTLTIDKCINFLDDKPTKDEDVEYITFDKQK